MLVPGFIVKRVQRDYATVLLYMHTSGPHVTCLDRVDNWFTQLGQWLFVQIVLSGVIFFFSYHFYQSASFLQVRISSAVVLLIHHILPTPVLKHIQHSYITNVLFFSNQDLCVQCWKCGTRRTTIQILRKTKGRHQTWETFAILTQMWPFLIKTSSHKGSVE